MFSTLSKCAIYILIVLTAISCSDDTPTPQANYKDILSNVSDQVIIQTYQDLDNKSTNFLVRLTEFISNRNQVNLDLVRLAWRDARKPWEQSEGFLFGPVDIQGIDPSIDSWPVNVIDLDAVLASSDALTKEYLDGLEGTLKGFHTLEYLIFGLNGNKSVQEFTNRQMEYLNACAQSLKGETSKLSLSWNSGTNPYGVILKTAGEASNIIYLSQKSALQELVDGIITIADEVGNGKINDPFVQSNLSIEESRFSANSKADFADNIRSIQNIYLGTLNAQFKEQSISQIVKSKSSTLDAKIVNQINLAISAILNIPGTFSEAVTANRPAIQNAQDQVRALQLILESELKPIFDTL